MVRGEKMKITLRILIFYVSLILALISIFSIPPVFLEKGVLIKSVQQNSTAYNQGLRQGMVIQEINSQKINSLESYFQTVRDVFDNVNETKLQINTKNVEVIGVFSQDFFKEVIVDEIPSTRIRTGLDIQGGARALVTAQDHKLTEAELDDLLSVTQERLNVYGLSDMVLRKQSDLFGNQFMILEIAGSSPKDLEELIAKQGKFEAKIGNETVFVGGNEDITYVGRTGQDASITECFTVDNGEVCNFRFVIFLSEKAAERHAQITEKLEVNSTSGGNYLSKTIDFYLDDELTDTLNIGADLKGKVATQVQISGSGSGPSRQEAIKQAEKDMKKLQTVLITGSLPFKLKIDKIDRISPFLGDNFVKAIFISMLSATLGVAIIIFLRYRKLKVSFLIVFMVISEIIIILGLSSLFKSNLDLAGIAGIIAAIGTGVDDQIVIVDESRKKAEILKLRIRNALFIVFTAYATAVASLFPLFYAGAGLLKGFAFTGLIGITAGVLITRPAFADMLSQLEEN
jgi:preprotein translocase subunit SecD